MRILLAVHALPAAGLGGTELLTKRLADELAGEHDVAVATPRGHETDVAGAAVYPLPDAADWTDPTGLDSGLESGVAHDAVDRAFGDVLADADPDVVHLQHLKFASAGLPGRCSAAGVPCLLTLHDFWTVCHREHLVRPSGTLCDGPSSVAKCAACYADGLRRTRGDGDGVPGNAGASPPIDVAAARRAVARRTAALETARDAADVLVAPSRFLREQFVRSGTPPAAIVHRRNGVDVSRFPATDFDADSPLSVGYAGRIAPSKGVHLLLAAFERVAGDARLEVFGAFDPAEDAYHAGLRERAPGAVTFHGRYDHPAAPYEAMDVLVVPSLWYENSPLVVQEAFASGVPVIAGDVGGTAELVGHGEDGLHFAFGDRDSLAGAIGRLVDSPATVRRLSAGVEPPKTLAEHARELLDLYGRCAARAGPGVGDPA